MTAVPPRPAVLFLCVHNAGRSQMAAGWLRHLAGDRVDVFSGGSDPGAALNPAAVEAMAEVGIDIAGERPRPWTEDDARAADVIVSMGCGDACPVLPGKRYEDWPLTDPAGQPVEVVRQVRDEIRARVETFDRRAAGGRLVTQVDRLAAEFVGTAFLLAAVVGSGIMAERLTDDVGLQLLQNAFATAGVLVALILALGPASGAHFNPAVTLADRILRGIDTRTAVGYVVAQVTGGIVGVVTANAMFGLSLVDWSTKDRSAGHVVFADGIATLGLLIVIFGVVRAGRSPVAAIAVGGYIGGAYYFTSSTSFANPAVTVARMFSDTFAGIAPASAPGFVLAQLVATVVAVVVIRAIYPRISEVADQVVVPHDSAG